MDIYFKERRLQKACNSQQESIKTCGPEIAQKLRQRLAELYAADCLSDISFLPSPRLHELSGNWEGCFAVDLKHPFRLVFKPLDPVPLNSDGGIDRDQVTSILIIEVEDYHGKRKKRKFGK